MLKILTNGVLTTKPTTRTAKDGRVYARADMQITGWENRPMPGCVKVYGFGDVGSLLASMPAGLKIHVRGYGQIDGAGGFHVRLDSVQTDEQRQVATLTTLRRLRDSLSHQPNGSAA